MLQTLVKFIDKHRKNNAALTVMSAVFENPSNCGRIVRDENDNLKAIVEEKDTSEEQKKIKENQGFKAQSYVMENDEESYGIIT